VGAQLVNPPAHAASVRATANDGAVLRVSAVTTYQGGTFRLQTTCPEPSHSTRLQSHLFTSPALLPANISKLATWTVDVARRQRPGSYWISLNCFELGTGRVSGAASIRINVLGTLQRAVTRGQRHGERPARPDAPARDHAPARDQVSSDHSSR
jgi:hypothetical protein